MDGDRAAGRLHRFSATDCHRMDEAGIPHEGHRFSVEDYYRLGEIGVLDEDSRVELIEGRIVDMNPIGTPHAAMVNRLTRILNAALAGRATISPQNPSASWTAQSRSPTSPYRGGAPTTMPSAIPAPGTSWW